MNYENRFFDSPRPDLGQSPDARTSSSDWSQRQFGTVPGQQVVQSILERPDWTDPVPLIRVVPKRVGESLAAEPASTGRPFPLVFGLLLCGPDAEELRSYFCQRGPWLDDELGVLVHLAVIGNPRHSSRPFRLFLKEFGFNEASLEREWIALARDYDSAEVTIRFEEKVAATSRNLSRADLPCLVVFVPKSSSPAGIIRFRTGAKPSAVDAGRMHDIVLAEFSAARIRGIAEDLKERRWSVLRKAIERHCSHVNDLLQVRSGRRRGRPKAHDPEQDERLVEDWKTSGQRKQEFEQARGLDEGAVAAAQNRIKASERRRARP